MTANPETGLLLHDYAKSSAAFRVRIALELKGLAYRRHPIDLLAGDQRSAQYRAVNPQGFVPCLEVDGQRIVQSLAIIDYLDARYPQPPLVPADPAERAHVLAMALVVACDIHPLNNLRIRRYLAEELAQPEEAVERWIARWIAEGLDMLEQLAAPRSGDWLFGERPGLADICLVPQLYNARRFGVPVAPYPALLRAEASALAHPAFIAAHPDRAAE